MKIIFEVNTNGTEEELNTHLTKLAKQQGWQEQVQKTAKDGTPMVDEDGEAIMEDNPVTAQEKVRDMIAIGLKVN